MWTMDCHRIKAYVDTSVNVDYDDTQLIFDKSVYRTGQQVTLLLHRGTRALVVSYEISRLKYDPLNSTRHYAACILYGR